MRVILPFYQSPGIRRKEGSWLALEEPSGKEEALVSNFHLQMLGRVEGFFWGTRGYCKTNGVRLAISSAPLLYTINIH